MPLTKEETKQILDDRQRAYHLAFNTPAGAAVLIDLMVFCRGKETCVVPGQTDMTWVLEGRREVLLRIQDHLDLSPDQLLEKYSRPAT